MTALDIAADVRAGRRTARDVLEEHLERIDAREEDIHAFNLVMREDARAAAPVERDRLGGVAVAV